MSLVKKPDWDFARQMALGLDLGDEQPPAQREDVAARLRSEAARQALEKRRSGAQAPAWLAEYDRLRGLGWPWRVAAYIAWASSPRRERWPETLEALATEVLGLTSARQIYAWRRKNPAIDEMVAMLQVAPLWEHRRDVFDALVQVASEPDYKGHADRKLFFEMIGDYIPRARLDTRRGELDEDDLAAMSDEELRTLAMAAKRLLEDDGDGVGEDEVG